jgi:galactoside O-acetyltransferase
LGRGAQVEPLFACDYGYNIRAGANLFVNFNCVRIGDDAVVGAGSVVARDVPSDAVAAGNPCRVIRQPVRPA